MMSRFVLLCLGTALLSSVHAALGDLRAGGAGYGQRRPDVSGSGADELEAGDEAGFEEVIEDEEGPAGEDNCDRNALSAACNDVHDAPVVHDAPEKVASPEARALDGADARSEQRAKRRMEAAEQRLRSAMGAIAVSAAEQEGQEEQGQGDEEAAFLMVGATEREARSMHPFAAGLD